MDTVEVISLLSGEIGCSDEFRACQYAIEWCLEFMGDIGDEFSLLTGDTIQCITQRCTLLCIHGTRNAVDVRLGLRILMIR